MNKKKKRTKGKKAAATRDIYIYIYIVADRLETICASLRLLINAKKSTHTHTTRVLASGAVRFCRRQIFGADALWVSPAADSYADVNNRCWPSVAVCAGPRPYPRQLLLTNRNAGHQSWRRQDAAGRAFVRLLREPSARLWAHPRNKDISLSLSLSLSLLDRSSSPGICV